MKTIKPQHLGVLTRCFERKQNCYFGVNILAFFRFGQPSTLLSEVAMWKFVPDELGEVPLELGIPKVSGEFLAKGSAFAPGGAATTCPVKVSLGKLKKELWVVGDRHWVGNRQTEPQAFEQMPIDWQHAYGGQGFVDNPLGKGYRAVETDNGPIQYLPNVELAGKLIRSPKKKPAPASFMPLDYTWPQRFSKMGTYDKKWMDSDFPGFARDIDWRLWNAASTDQQQDQPFVGDENFAIENMHPSKATLRGRLPGIQTRCLVTQRSDKGDRLEEILTRLMTVWFFPHAECGVLVFQGFKEIQQDDGRDIVHLLVAAEKLGKNKDKSHYKAVLEQRLDKEKGAIYALKDDDLMPPPADGQRDDAMQSIDDPLKEVVETEGLAHQNMKRRQLAEIDKARAHASSLGLDPDQYAPMPPPDMVVPKDPAKLVEFIEAQELQAAEMKRQAEEQQAQMQTELQTMCEEKGISVEDFKKQNVRKGPPVFSPDQEVNKMRSLAKSARDGGTPIQTLEAQLDDPQYVARLEEQGTQLIAAYRMTVHHQDAAVVDEGRDQHLRSELENAIQSGQSLQGLDLTGADLSGMDLREADLHGVFLESANLEGCNLANANLTQAVLAHANLRVAIFDGATLNDANLGASDLSGASLEKCHAQQTVFAKADLGGASLRGTDLTSADFMETRFGNTDLREIKGEQLNFVKTDFAGSRFEGAVLKKCNFLEVSVEGASFRNAQLTSSVFLTTKGRGADFGSADMHNVRFVMNCDFEGAKFLNANLDKANLRGALLRGADFSEASLNSADLSDCDLQDANLYKIVAKDALLVRTNLRGAVLMSANLMNSLLQKADIRGADLRNSNLFAADFSRVRSDNKTTVQFANQKRARVKPTRKS